ncbi:MAG: acyltransferase [Burkholderiales bacterium]|nr:acyltransferase [Burkholderiales bacterium]
MNRSGKYLYVLDLVRFLAAVWVMGYHFMVRHSSTVDGLGIIVSRSISQFFTYGYLGVPIFFIISGFVIMQSAQGRSWYEFLFLRLLRIFPLYWLGLLFAIIALTLSPKILVASDPDILAFTNMLSLNHLLLSCFHLFNQIIMLFDDLVIRGFSRIYFGQQITYSLWVAQAWSLREEIKFYILIAALLFLFGNSRQIMYWVVLFNVALIALLGKMSFLFPWSCFFAVGVSISLYQIKPCILRLIAIWLQVGFTCIVASKYYLTISLISHDISSAENIVVYIIILTTLFMLFFIKFPSLDIKFKNKAYKLLGIWSYPIYIIHEIPGVIMIKLLANFGFSYLISAIYIMLLVVIISALLNIIDERIQKYGKNWFYSKFKIIRN